MKPEPKQWIEVQPGYILGGIKTDPPKGAVTILDTEYDYCEQTGETYVYVTWLCEAR